MRIIPAIDLINGECVRLFKGDYAAKTVYEKDPAAMLRKFAESGAKMAHIVDLDGAKDKNKRQTALLKKLAGQFPEITIECGGGIRGKEDVQNLLDAGIGRVIIGSLCVKDPATVTDCLKTFGADKIVLGLDVKMTDGIPYILTDAWYGTSDKTIYSLLDYYMESVKSPIVLCTDIAKDGTLTGPNFELYRNLKQNRPAIRLIASGGVSSERDLAELNKIPCEYAVIGKALYENQIDLTAVIKEYDDE